MTFDERDVQIAICKAFGFTDKQTALRIRTLEFPAGISERTVQNRLAASKLAFAEVSKYIAEIRRELDIDAKVVTKQTVRAELELLLGDAVATIRAALKDQDVKAAEAVLDRVLGKPSQVHKHEGDVNVNHTMVWQGRKELLEQEQDMLDSEKLLSAAPSDVLEAEVVEH